MKRSCGTCSLCCKLPYLGELNKPIDTWCTHARPGCGGCAIYAERPSACRRFQCAWLASTDFGDEWFPVRSKMIITPRVGNVPIEDQGLLVTVDPAFPTAWRREPYYSQLREWAQTFFVQIRIGLRCISLRADGMEHEDIRTRAWIEDREEVTKQEEN